jgi:two-component system chemotaxis response regulator CheB
MPDPAKIRVLVVDDSVVVRRLITHGLAEDPEIEVVGSAADGLIALKMVPLVRPDVITLDIEMPHMDGIETLRRVRALHPHVRVIMFSSLSEKGAAVTLEALSIGANDYVTKPAGANLDASVAQLRAELLPRIKQFFSSRRRADGEVSRRSFAPRAARACNPCDVVAVGVSTGGPTALAQFVPAIPDTFRPPILVVQHMPPIFTRLLAERLQSLTRLLVREADHGMSVDPGSIYIAPGDFHMRVVKQGQKRHLELDKGQQENYCRPAVDVLFRSVSESYGANSIAVVLTGMGQDGRLGAERMREAGSWVIAQDEASSVVWGMPGAVVRAGLADSVLELSRIAPELVRLTESGGERR